MGSIDKERQTVAQVFSSKEKKIGRMDSRAEMFGGDPLGDLILAKEIRRADLFSGTAPKTPFERELETKVSSIN